MAERSRKHPETPPDDPASTAAILESISDGVFTVDLDWRVTSFNRAAEEITGVPREEAVGRPCSEVLRSSLCEVDCPLRRTLETGEPIIGRSCYIVRADGERIPISISTAVFRDSDGTIIGGAETFRDMTEVETLRRKLETQGRAGELVSRSPLMQRIFDILPAIADSPSTVLIVGETGVGKEVLARTIHDMSPRSDGPFVAVNCGALPETLLESELFGYKAGAFTGATRDKPGRFALARGGTIFLDEIGDVPPSVQVKLLRVLQEKTFEPLGATRPEKADCRVIAATNRDLGEYMKTGKFREDLYYRLNVIRIEVPPLRERKEDIPLLVDEFITRFNDLQNADVQGITPEAMALLMAWDWPGNVRELENVIERAFVLCKHGLIGVEHLPDEITGARHRGTPAPRDIASAREVFEAELIRAALERNNYNRLAAAKELGMHKTTLFRKIRKLGIRLPEVDGRSSRSAKRGKE